MTSFKKKFQQKSSLSQVFLTTDWPCLELASLLKKKNVDKVVEVGPGKGVLTKVLLQNDISVHALELDKRLKPYLDGIKEEYKSCGFEVTFKSALDFDLLSWAKSQLVKPCVCGNIPYNISSQILLWSIAALDYLSGAFFLVQKEFAERLAASPSSKSYGSLSVYVQLRASVTYQYTVEKDCFTPVPKVDSAIVSLEPLIKKESQEVLDCVEKITRLAFQQRRKKLSNSLSKMLDGLDSFKPPVDLTRRCDSLSPSEYVSLAKEFLLCAQKKSSF